MHDTIILLIVRLGVRARVQGSENKGRAVHHTYEQTAHTLSSDLAPMPSHPKPLLL